MPRHTVKPGRAAERARRADAAPRAPRHNLPAPLTSFVGRESEIAEVRRLLAASRLVTLTGPGGCGKTRLAIEAARAMADEQPGVWLVELAALADPSLVPQTVAAVLGVDAPATLAEALRERRLLLVLDNCDHLLAACAALAEALLHHGAELRILATSREALGITGEIAWPVPPLSMPGPGPAAPPALERYAAVRLFVERARTLVPGFALTAANAAAVAQICRRLDGIPLAIELAAARARVLSVEQIAERLDDRFRLLTSGSRTAVPRHQTLQATMDWSYHLLSEEEERLFRRLGAFAGSFALPAVEEICAGEGLDAGQVLDLLSHLVDKSLVSVERHGGEVRYRLLETIRHYALDRLRAAGEEEALRARHRTWYLALVCGEERGRAWMERLDLEHDNVRGALRWSVARGDAAAALELAVGLHTFWRIRGHITEARTWLASALALPGDAPALRARALGCAGFLALEQNDHRAALPLLEEALGLHRALGNASGIGDTLMQLGRIASFQGDHARARALLDEAVALLRETGDRKTLAVAINVLGIVTSERGDHNAAAPYYAEALEIQREFGDRWSQSAALNNLGLVALHNSDYAGATPLLEESLALAAEIGNLRGVATASLNLGNAALHQGDVPRARELIERSLDAFLELGVQSAVMKGLEGLAAVAAALGDAGRAGRLLGAADRLGEELEMPPVTSDDSLRSAAVSAVRAAVGETGLAAAVAEGRRMTLDEAIAYARGTAAAAPAVPAATLRIAGLGPAQVLRGDHAISSSEWTYAKGRELLFYLLSYPSRSKEQIGLALWPDASPAQLRANFRVTLYHLRRALGRPDWITFTAGGYAFNRALDYWYDVEAFEAALADARRLGGGDAALAALARATALYRGAFLEDVADGEWVLLRREELAAAQIEALLTLGRLAFDAGRFEQAAEAYRRVIAHDAYLETAHRELMRCYVRLGERGRALRHYQAFADQMRDELGSPPDRETVALVERVRRGDEI